MEDKDKLIAELKAENERLEEENYQLQKDCQICENFIDFIDLARDKKDFITSYGY